MRKSVQRRVTINDIAKHAGVSKTAVSFAFNLPGRLSEETTRHILHVARELGYTPNPIARSLNTRRTNALGLIVPQDIADALANPFYPALMSGIGQICKSEGLSLMIVPPMRGSMVDATYAALIDGCIVTGLEANHDAVNALIQRNMPFVMIDTDAPSHISSVNVEDSEGARLQMKHVLDLGHRNIGIASIDSDKSRVEDYTGTLRHRFDGYQSALKAEKLALDSPGITIVETHCSVTGGINAFQRLMDAVPRPTAIVALSDVIAYGIIEAAHARGMRVPEDLSVIGFDDIDSSSLIQPTLTTVQQPIVEKGRRAAATMIEILTGNTQCEHILLPVHLVVRQSTGRRPR